MNLSKEKVDSVVKTQMTIWILAILFASGYALFAKLIWTANFPILIFLPIMMIGFAFASIKNIRQVLATVTDGET